MHTHKHTLTHTAIFRLLSLIIWHCLCWFFWLPQPVCWGEQGEVPLAEARGLASSGLPRRSNHQWLWGSLHGPSATPTQVRPPLPVSKNVELFAKDKLEGLSSFTILYSGKFSRGPNFACLTVFLQVVCLSHHQWSRMTQPERQSFWMELYGPSHFYWERSYRSCIVALRKGLN